MLEQAKALRFEYEPMSQAERCLRLERLYDESIAWLEEAVQERVPKGTGAATLVLERTRMEIDELERAGHGAKPQEIHLVFKQGEKEQGDVE